MDIRNKISWLDHHGNLDIGRELSIWISHDGKRVHSTDIESLTGLINYFFEEELFARCQQ